MQNHFAWLWKMVNAFLHFVCMQCIVFVFVCVHRAKREKINLLNCFFCFTLLGRRLSLFRCFPLRYLTRFHCEQGFMFCFRLSPAACGQQPTFNVACFLFGDERFVCIRHAAARCSSERWTKKEKKKRKRQSSDRVVFSVDCADSETASFSVEMSMHHAGMHRNNPSCKKMYRLSFLQMQTRTK